ncbi:MAG: acyl-CoA dehydrogenase family protein, partial [Candidatus Saccharibacteria bacterium]
MVSLELTREQKKLVEKTRELVEGEIQPHSLRMDQRGDDSFDGSLIELLAKHNLVCPTIPRDFGGLGLSHLSTALVIEEIAAGSAGLASVVDANMHAASPIILAGSENLKKQFLPLLTSDSGAIASFALTEPQAGSD